MNENPLGKSTEEKLRELRHKVHEQEKRIRQLEEELEDDETVEIDGIHEVPSRGKFEVQKPLHDVMREEHK